MVTHRVIHKKEDYCTGRPKGFLCISGITNRFYECSYPHYEGWRPCSTGTECTVVGYHTSTPCKAPRGGGNENENTEDSHGSRLGNFTSSSSYMESSSLVINGKNGENVFEKLEWWHWLLIGVGIFLVVGIVVSLLIRLAIHLKRKKGMNDLGLEEGMEKKKEASPEATVLCISPHHQQERVEENKKREEVRNHVDESIISSSDSTSTTNSATSSGGGNKISQNRVDRDLINTM